MGHELAVQGFSRQLFFLSALVFPVTCHLILALTTISLAFGFSLSGPHTLSRLDSVSVGCKSICLVQS